MVPWVTPFVPGNIVEKVLVNAFFPGGAGAIAGEILYTQSTRRKFSVESRSIWLGLAAHWLWTAGWSLFQFWGYMQNINGSYGGNLFESPLVFPLNFLLASLSIFTPDVVGFRQKQNSSLPWIAAQKKLILPFRLKSSMSFHVRRKGSGNHRPR